jgi:hypothetical protein
VGHCAAGRRGASSRLACGAQREGGSNPCHSSSCCNDNHIVPLSHTHTCACAREALGGSGTRALPVTRARSLARSLTRYNNTSSVLRKPCSMQRSPRPMETV